MAVNDVCMGLGLYRDVHGAGNPAAVQRTVLLAQPEI